MSDIQKREWEDKFSERYQFFDDLLLPKGGTSYGLEVMVHLSEDLKHFIRSIEDAKEKEVWKKAGKMIEKVKTFSVTHPKMFGGEIEETYVNKKDLLAIFSSQITSTKE